MLDYLFLLLKGSAAARPTPNTNLANGSVVFDFFLVLAIGFGEYFVDAFFAGPACFVLRYPDG